jgi:hypothetical protein
MNTLRIPVGSSELQNIRDSIYFTYRRYKKEANKKV